jgi:hypothetical protein
MASALLPQVYGSHMFRETQNTKARQEKELWKDWIVPKGNTPRHDPRTQWFLFLTPRPPWRRKTTGVRSGTDTD